MPDTTAEWHLTLTDSVYALGAAARELRAAHQHAHLTARTADPARLIPVTGLLTVPGAEPVRPHDEALWQLADLYAVLEHHTRELYENAALGYAYGTAYALTAVLRSEHPRHTELSRDRAGRYVRSAEGLPDLAQSISHRAGGRELADARARFIEYDAAEGDQDDVEPEPTADLADAAYAYGERAERVLHHLLRLADNHGFLRAS